MTHKEKIKLVKFEFSITWEYIEIILGEKFKTFNNIFHLNTTPYQDANLQKINDYVVRDKFYTFSSQGEDFEISYNKFGGSKKIAEFISNINNQNKFLFNKSYNNDVKIQTKGNFFSVRLEDTSYYSDVNVDNKKWLIIDYNKYCCFVQIKNPLSPQQRFEKIKTLKIIENTIIVECMGPDVWNNTDSNPNSIYSYKWELNLQPEVRSLIESLIKEGFNKIIR